MNIYQKILNKAPLQNRTRAKEVVLLRVEQIGNMVYGDTEKWMAEINILKESFSCTCPSFWHQRNKAEFVDIPEVEKVPCKHICRLCIDVLGENI